MTLQLVGEALSTFCSAACKHLATVGSRHSLAETMLFHAMDFLRLISSFHFTNLLCPCVAAMSSQQATFKNATIKKEIYRHSLSILHYTPKPPFMSTKKLSLKPLILPFLIPIHYIVVEQQIKHILLFIIAAAITLFLFKYQHISNKLKS